MSTQTKVRLAPDTSLYWNVDPDAAEVLQDRFHHVKEQLRRQESFEITNRYVMSVLLDLYWIHHENEEQP